MGLPSQRQRQEGPSAWVLLQEGLAKVNEIFPPEGPGVPGRRSSHAAFHDVGNRLFLDSEFTQSSGGLQFLHEGFHPVGKGLHASHVQDP